MKRTIGISVDFDYFVPEDVMLDMQHVESLFHLRVIWEIRGAHLFEQLRTNGEERTFWQQLEPLLRNYRRAVTVSDSHVFALRDPRLVACDTIILFDRHPDCWPITSEDRREGTWYCHTWGRGWLEGDKSRRLIWVYPDGQDASDYKDGRRGLSRQFRALPRKEFDPAAFTLRSLEAVHVCRSGCWTPPWTDLAFVDFVRAVTDTPVVLQNDAWNPLKPRWDDIDGTMKQLREREAQMWAAFRGVTKT